MTESKDGTALIVGGSKGVGLAVSEEAACCFVLHLRSSPSIWAHREDLAAV